MSDQLRSFRFVPLLLPFTTLVLFLTPVPPMSPQSSDPDFIYIPGTLGADPASGELGEGVAAQVHQAMKNIGAILEAENTDFSRVVSVNVFLSDTRYFSEMNAAYRSYFPDEPPTRATVGVDLPMPGALVQIAMVAVRPGVTRRVVKPDELKSPELPYSWGVMTGNTLFIAGATSRDPNTYQPVTGDVGTQTRRVFGNIGAVLRAAEMDYGDLTSCTVFIDDPRDFAAMNAAYREFVGDDPPARATVRAGLMNPLFKVEIQCVAHRGPSRSVIVAEGSSLPRSPFSPAIQVGNRVFTAGMVGSGSDGLAKGEIETQTRQTLENLGSTLAAAQMDFGDVNAVYVYTPHITHADAVSSMLDEFIGTGSTRVVIGADLMGPDYLVEIMMFASKAGQND